MINARLSSEAKNLFETYQGTTTAFPCGIDSVLVLFLAGKFLGKEWAIAVISKSESLKDND